MPYGRKSEPGRPSEPLPGDASEVSIASAGATTEGIFVEPKEPLMEPREPLKELSPQPGGDPEKFADQLHRQGIYVHPDQPEPPPEQTKVPGKPSKPPGKPSLLPDDDPLELATEVLGKCTRLAGFFLVIGAGILAWHLYNRAAADTLLSLGLIIFISAYNFVLVSAGLKRLIRVLVDQSSAGGS
jgi:hypothetical protein